MDTLKTFVGMNGEHYFIRLPNRKAKVSSILPKKERKQFDLSYHSSKVEFFRSFFGRIEDTKKTFRN